MMRWAGVLMLVLMVAPAAADEKKKKDDKKKDDKKAAEAPAAPLAADLAKDAAAKEAAGDLDGAIAAMKEAVRLPDATGETSLQLGRLLDAKSELDLAMDAYKTAAEKLSGAITETPAPSRVKPSTATGQVGAVTTTSRAREATTAPERRTGTAPYRATRESPDSRSTRLATR